MKRELIALLSALIALAAAVGILFLIHLYADKRDSVALIALLALPLLVYVILSGRLLEVTGPGGGAPSFAILRSRRSRPPPRSATSSRCSLSQKDH
jgi:hypothetical protein